MSNALDLFSLDGRTALITGATRGIGQNLAIALAEAGSDIVLIQRPGSKDTNTKDDVEKLGRQASIFYADLANASDMKGLVKKITDAGHDIDILINCGGIQRRHPAQQFPDDDWNEVSKPSYSPFTALKSSTRFFKSISPLCSHYAAMLEHTCSPESQKATRHIEARSSTLHH
jgi:NAD(P)-dependent dehydrogenase (short-subunit alcohol dehydrogenase family)